MRLKILMPALLLATVAGCDSILDVQPVNELSEEQAINDAAGARAALAGIYDALQGASYYGQGFLVFSDLPADDVVHRGTFTTYADADANRLTADNSSLESIWDALYQAVGRANIVLARVPDVPGLSDAERGQIIGEAHFLRALSFHNVVKLWGDSAPASLGAPIPTVVPATVSEASQISRATTAETYAQILDDLQAAEQVMTVETSHRQASIGAVRALRARVHLYRENWAEAEAAAEEVAGMGYALATNYEDLFAAEGADTPEDIFKVAFTAVEYNLMGFYYRARVQGGRQEVSPSELLEAAYPPNDVRKDWNISITGTVRYGSKWPTGAGAEDVHVIRFAEVLLIKAEAEARQGKLNEAVASINPIRVRAGLLPLVTPTVLTQQQILDEIELQRRLELAMEGDRWPDLVRRGRALQVMGITDRPEQRLFPIPQNELDVAPSLSQNPGY